MRENNSFNVQRLIAEVAAQHGLFLKPDDAAFALVTMNRLVLEESLEAIRSRRRRGPRTIPGKRAVGAQTRRIGYRRGGP